MITFKYSTPNSKLADFVSALPANEYFIITAVQGTNILFQIRTDKLVKEVDTQTLSFYQRKITHELRKNQQNS